MSNLIQVTILKQQEKEGIILVIVTIFIAGTLPVITKYGTGLMNPLLFATLSSLIAGIFLLLLAIIQGKWRLLGEKRYFPFWLLIGFFGTTLSNICFFVGVTLTSGINSSILLQVEPLYALLIGYLFLKEKITFKQIFFTLIIIWGTLVVILYREEFKINWGDLLVLLTPLCWQIAHFFSKKLLTTSKEITPQLIATARTFFGGIFLLILNILVGFRMEGGLAAIKEIWWLLLFQGIIGFALQHTLWYKVLQKLNLSKAVALISAYPAFSILLARLILKEVPDFYQLLGFGIIVLGIFGLSSVKSEQRE